MDPKQDAITKGNSREKITKTTHRVAAGILAAVMAFATVGFSGTASASPNHHGSRINYGSCGFEMYHDYNGRWAKAETWNKGGCSEVYADIAYNGTSTSWQADNNVARAEVSGNSIRFDHSGAKGRITGGGVSGVWVMS